MQTRSHTYIEGVKYVCILEDFLGIFVGFVLATVHKMMVGSTVDREISVLRKFEWSNALRN